MMNGQWFSVSWLQKYLHTIYVAKIRIIFQTDVSIKDIFIHIYIPDNQWIE